MKVILSTKQWERRGDVWAKGYAFTSDGRLLLAGNLAEFLSSIKSETEFVSNLKTLNGLFSVVVNSPTLQVAAVDASRNFPLFYRYDEGNVVLADEPYVLRRQNDVLDEVALAQYDSAGAVSEGLTLVKDILQVKPGFMFVFGAENPVEHQFFTMAVRKEDVKPLSRADFAHILDRLTDRFVRSLCNRQVVIPLTGGYDSRLIACLLHRAGYENVVCYTIGTDDSREVTIAKNVARKLGFTHYQVDVTQTVVAPLQVMESDDFKDYYRKLGAYGNFLWLYDYFAVRYLKEHGLIEHNACFAPGHSGDSIAGSHLTKSVVGAEDSAKELAKTILYYNNEYGYRKELLECTKEWFAKYLQDGYLPYSVFQAYVFQNRQAHQIVNAARVYEHFGYELRMPLWDAELMNAMRCLPYECYINRSFYNSNLQDTFFKPLGVSFEGDGFCPSEKVFKRQLLKKRMKHYLPNFILHYMTDLKGSDGEYTLMQPLLKQLIDNGVYVGETDCLSVNKTIRDWYLMKVREDVTNKTID